MSTAQIIQLPTAPATQLGLVILAIVREIEGPAVSWPQVRQKFNSWPDETRVRFRQLLRDRVRAEFARSRGLALGLID